MSDQESEPNLGGRWRDRLRRHGDAWRLSLTAADSDILADVRLSDLNDEVEVITARPLEPRRVYLCLSASNPTYVDPVLVPELAAG